MTLADQSPDRADTGVDKNPAAGCRVSASSASRLRRERSGTVPQVLSCPPGTGGLGGMPLGKIQLGDGLC
jgi:hypothetical protein